MTTPPPAASWSEVCAITRTRSLTSITSAPASRSSWSPLSSWLVPTLVPDSVTVIRMPGPTAGTVPARMPSVSACWRARATAVRRASVSLPRESRVRCRSVISLSARWEASERLLMYWIRSPCRAPT